MTEPVCQMSDDIDTAAVMSINGQRQNSVMDDGSSEIESMPLLSHGEVFVLSCLLTLIGR